MSRALQNLAFRHTRFVNARKRRIGHLFQGRYKALLVDAEPYLLELVRYVHEPGARRPGRGLGGLAGRTGRGAGTGPIWAARTCPG